MRSRRSMTLPFVENVPLPRWWNSPDPRSPGAYQARTGRSTQRSYSSTNLSSATTHSMLAKHSRTSGAETSLGLHGSEAKSAPFVHVLAGGVPYIHDGFSQSSGRYCNDALSSITQGVVAVIPRTKSDSDQCRGVPDRHVETVGHQVWLAVVLGCDQDGRPGFHQAMDEMEGVFLEIRGSLYKAQWVVIPSLRARMVYETRVGPGPGPTAWIGWDWVRWLAPSEES
jgi:hypothetical protein